MEKDAPSPAKNVPTNTDHAAGASEADSSEPQIPRLGEGGAAPGAHDPSRTTAEAPVLSDGIADAAATGDAQTAPGAASPAKPRRAQQQQQRQPDPETEPESDQQEGFQGAGYPEADQDSPVQEDVAADLTRDMDPDISTTVPDMAPAEEVPEDDPDDTSLIGEGHADKAAWNRARTQAPQPGYDAVAGTPPGRTPGSSEDMGYPGGAPGEGVPGLDTGDGRLDELAEDAEADEEAMVEDAVDNLDDDTAPLTSDPDLRGDAAMADEGAPGSRLEGHDGRADLPEHRYLAGEGLAPEDRLLADENEDAMFAEGEMGLEDDLEMEQMNETDDIAADFEDSRADLDEGASGNERQSSH